jgi:hypothetical protein
MKLVKLSNIIVPDLPNNVPPYQSRKFPNQGFPLHMRMCVVGGVGAGKTSFVLKFLKWYDKVKAFDRCIFFSPTLEGENKGETLIAEKHNFEVVVYKHYNDTTMREEADMIKQRISEWKLWNKKKEAWERFKKCKDTKELDLEDLMLLENIGWEAPHNEFPNGYPSHVLILDDLVGQKGVFSSNCRGFLTEFILQSRHHSASVIVLSQVYKTFLPNQLRQGSFDKWVLFGTKSKHRESIAEEMSDKIEVEKFMQIWDFVCDVPHKCLFVDYTAPLKYMFRSGLDKLVQFEDDALKSIYIEKDDDKHKKDTDR